VRVTNTHPRLSVELLTIFVFKFNMLFSLKCFIFVFLTKVKCLKCIKCFALVFYNPSCSGRPKGCNRSTFVYLFRMFRDKLWIPLYKKRKERLHFCILKKNK